VIRTATAGFSLAIALLFPIPQGIDLDFSMASDPVSHSRFFSCHRVIIPDSPGNRPGFFNGK